MFLESNTILDLDIRSNGLVARFDDYLSTVRSGALDYNSLCGADQARALFGIFFLDLVLILFLYCPSPTLSVTVQCSIPCM